MEITLIEFISHVVQNPTYLVIVLLIFAVILVNGWTDSPNAIATCVSTRSLSPKKSIILASIFNFLGVLIMCMLSGVVAETIYNMVDFGSNNTDSLIGLCAGMFAVVIWSVTSWLFGIPTSESHALIAGITGAAIALQGFAAINGAEWIKVIYGLIISLVVGFILGFIIVRIIEKICKNMIRSKTLKFFKYGQICSASFMAFMHGAQDGQKFIGVFLLATYLVNGIALSSTFEIPVWLMILCSIIMTIGTSIGGYRIIKKVGIGMVKLEKYQGFAADLAGATCLLGSTIAGIPVSTTHTKTSAIMGVGTSKRLSNVNWSIVKEIILTWILTFPGCGLLGWVSAYLFIQIF